MHNTGVEDHGEIVAAIQHFLGERPGDWRVTILGSRENDDWEMTIDGPQGFRRAYTLAGCSWCPSTGRDSYAFA